MTDNQWNALQHMASRGMVFECEMSLGKVRLQPSDLHSYELIYPTHTISLYRDSSISSSDKYYLHYMYDEWLSRNMFTKSSFHYSSI